MTEREAEIFIKQQILDTLRTKNLSVYSDPDEELREYSAMMDSGHILTLECALIRVQGNVKHYEYTLFIDKHMIMNETIANNSRIHTPKEQEILRLFNLCSAKIMQQEMQLQMRTAGIDPRTRMN